MKYEAYSIHKLYYKNFEFDRIYLHLFGYSNNNVMSFILYNSKKYLRRGQALFYFTLLVLFGSKPLRLYTGPIPD